MIANCKNYDHSSIKMWGCSVIDMDYVVLFYPCRHREEEEVLHGIHFDFSIKSTVKSQVWVYTDEEERDNVIEKLSRDWKDSKKKLTKRDI